MVWFLIPHPFTHIWQQQQEREPAAASMDGGSLAIARREAAGKQVGENYRLRLSHHLTLNGRQTDRGL